jgi:2-keto-4-pentenoate hydratase/2-oxohepta-3-ene-1,7-dioic acid hydratase in catechol pathway
VKLLFFDEYRLGVLTSEGVADVTNAVADAPGAGPQDLITWVIERWESYHEVLQRAADSATLVALESVRIRPPLPKPTNIDCMARNYMENGTLPERPEINAFLKSANSIIGHLDTMVLPDIPATIFEGEAELAVVIGKRAQNVSAADAMDYVFGYTNLIDGSARGIPPRDNAFYQMKSRETFCPIGPFLVTADEVPDPHDLPVRLWNNGVLMQDFNTSDMAYDIAESIEFVSSIHTLEPGDIVATGTNHRGLHAFMDGDRVELQVGDLGRLSVSVRDDLHRTWGRETRHEWAQTGKGRTTPQLTGKYAKDALQPSKA